MHGPPTVAALTLGALALACSAERSRCDELLRQRDHAAVLKQCPDTEAARLSQAFQDSTAGNPNRPRASAVADSFIGGRYTDDAMYLRGYLDISSNVSPRQAHGQVVVALSRTLFRMRGRYAEAADAGRQLAYAGGARDGVRLALLAVEDARRSGQPRALNAALTALAEAYVDMGMDEDARDAFVHAESAGGPMNRLAYTYLKHGALLITLDGETERRAGIDYLAEAKRLAESSGADYVARAARLKLAVPHVERGEMAAVALLLEGLDGRDAEVIRGYARARQGILTDADGLLVSMDLGADELDYYLRFALAAARGAQGKGDLETAATYYRRGIEAVEKMRRDAARPELRPRVLARRSTPYLELIDLLARRGAAGDALEALAVAEALHARNFLDVVVGRQAGSDAELRAAQVRAAVPPQPSLSADELLARLRGREALVFVAGWRFHVVDGQVTAHPLTAADLEAARAFRDAPGDPARAARAAAALLPPTLSDRDDPLYLVPGGQLTDVPFAALPVGGRSLIERRALARVPGLAALGCRARTPGWTDARAFIGDAIGDLPAAAAEVRALGGEHARVGARADRASVLDAATAALLHVAVHGHVSRAGGVIDLADGPLSAGEIVEHQVGPRTVVLTGCDTAATAEADPESWDSFPSAFLAAGSAFVLATLRTIPDSAAAVVVDRYYRHPDALSPVDRLAATQRDAARLERALRPLGLPSPLPASVWASFGVWGDAECGP